MSEIDKEFQDLANQINLKLKEAAEALKEANELAKKAKLPSLIDAYYIREDMSEEESDLFQEKLDLLKVSEFEKQLDIAGWSSSSSYC